MIATHATISYWDDARITGEGYEKTFVEWHHTDIGRSRFGMWRRRWKRFKRRYNYRSTCECDASTPTSTFAQFDM
jgi:hypothetical protein